MSKRRSPGGGSITLRPGNKALIRVTMADGSRRGRTVSVQGATDDERREDAQRQLDALIGVLAEEGQLGIGGVTLRGWAGVWLERMEREQPQSAVAYRSRIKNHIATASFADDLIENIRPRDIRHWMRGLLTKLKPTTVSVTLSIMRMILRSAVEDDIIERNPADGVRIPRARLRAEPGARKPLSRDDLLAALRSDRLPLDARALIAVAGVCGLRSGEAHAMPLDCVIRRDGMLLLHVKFGGYGGIPTKGRKERFVPVLQPALHVLEEWLSVVPPKGRRNREGLLFPESDGGRRRYSHAAIWLRETLATIGIETESRFHDLRHTAATAWQNGWFGPHLAPEHVQAILGHSSVAQTEEYTGGAAEAMLKVAGAILAKDQEGIRRLSLANGTTAFHEGFEAEARSFRCTTKPPEASGTYAESDPIQILRESTSDLIAACADGTATVEQVMDWRALVLDAEPDVFRRARELEADPYLFRRALEIARDLMPMIGAAPSDEEEGAS